MKIKVKTAKGNKLVEYTKERIGNKIIFTIDGLCYKLDAVYSRQGQRGEYIEDGTSYLYKNKGERKALLHNGYEIPLRSDKSIIEYLLSKDSNRFRFDLEFINDLDVFKGLLYSAYQLKKEVNYESIYEGYFNDRIVLWYDIGYLTIKGKNKFTTFEFQYIILDDMHSDFINFRKQMTGNRNAHISLNDIIKMYCKKERMTDLINSI